MRQALDAPGTHAPDTPDPCYPCNPCTSTYGCSLQHKRLQALEALASLAHASPPGQSVTQSPGDLPGKLALLRAGGGAAAVTAMAAHPAAAAVQAAGARTLANLRTATCAASTARWRRAR